MSINHHNYNLDNWLGQDLLVPNHHDSFVAANRSSWGSGSSIFGCNCGCASTVYSGCGLFGRGFWGGLAGGLVGGVLAGGLMLGARWLFGKVANWVSPNQGGWGFGNWGFGGGNGWGIGGNNGYGVGGNNSISGDGSRNLTRRSSGTSDDGDKGGAGVKDTKETGNPTGAGGAKDSQPRSVNEIRSDIKDKDKAGLDALKAEANKLPNGDEKTQLLKEIDAAIKDAEAKETAEKAAKEAAAKAAAQKINNANDIETLLKISFDNLTDADKTKFLDKLKVLLAEYTGDINDLLSKLPDEIRFKVKQSRYRSGNTNYDGNTELKDGDVILAHDNSNKHIKDTENINSQKSNITKSNSGKHPQKIVIHDRKDVTYTYKETVDGEYIYESDKGHQKYVLQKRNDGRYYLEQYEWHKGYGEKDWS